MILWKHVLSGLILPTFPIKNSCIFGRYQVPPSGVFFHQFSCFGGHFGVPKPSGRAFGRHPEKSSNFDTAFLAVLNNFGDFGVPPGGLKIDLEQPAPKHPRWFRSSLGRPGATFTAFGCPKRVFLIFRLSFWFIFTFFHTRRKNTKAKNQSQVGIQIMLLPSGLF